MLQVVIIEEWFQPQHIVEQIWQKLLAALLTAILINKSGDGDLS